MLQHGVRRFVANCSGLAARRAVLCRCLASDATVKSDSGSDDISVMLKDAAIKQAKSWKSFADKMMTVPLPLESSNASAVHDYVMTAVKFRKDTNPITEMDAVLAKFGAAEEENTTFDAYIESCTEIQDSLKLSPEAFTLFSLPKSSKFSGDAAFETAKKEADQLASRVLPSSCPKDFSYMEKLQYLEEYCRYQEDCKNTHNKADELERVLDGKWIEKPKVLEVASWISGAPKKTDDGPTTHGMTRMVKL